jgi:DNA (cytosine-5)-methyltransferase 1
MSTGQINLLDEIIVDNFAGGGGASTGMELATGRVVDIAINHDPDAILMHRTNHPHTTHYQASVWDVDPVEVCRGRPVGLAWFSPDCKHFSKAKGGKPVDKNIRGLAWIVLRWAGTVRPRVIILENVEEFQTWGPVRKGKPVKKLTGQTFRKWLDQLRNLGYDVEWRELVAADYGAPTTRKRFFLIARCDGRPIVWPTPTHAPADSPEVKAGLRKPWRSAAEIIDWSLPTPSIFDTKESIREKYNLAAQRPLRPNTMARVARGVDKFVIKTASPFLVVVNHSGEFRGQDPGEPLQTVTAKHGYGVAMPVMVAIGQTGGGNRCRSVESPTHTQVSKAEECVASPLLAPWTVTNTTNSTGHPVPEPVDTARTGGGGGQMFLSASLVQYHTEQGERVRGQGLDTPLLTVDASNRYGLSAVCLEKYYGTATGQGAGEPLHTITAKDREGVVAAHMVKLKGTNLGGPVSEPVQTITAGGGHFGVVTTMIAPVSPGADLKNWPKIRELLNTYCGYGLKEDEVILFQITGGLYFMADIGLRMLTPRELYRANGFPDDYIIDRDYTGKEYGKAKQVARCGNAVPPPFATALVRANIPEWCGQTITTMEELEKAVAV